MAIYPRFDLCVNGDQGIPHGHITGVHFSGIDNETLLELAAPDWEPTRCPRFSRLKGAIKISRRKFQSRGYTTWVGNWCWDRITVTPAVGADLLNYLKSLGWQSEGGMVDFGILWDRGKFRPSDIAAACMTPEELAERKRLRALPSSPEAPAAEAR